jgi:ABC-type amino acid transport substrate-binding protein
MFVVGAQDQISERTAKPDLSNCQLLTNVQDAGVLRVAVNFDMPGFACRKADSSGLEGFEIDLARRIAKDIFGCANESVDSHLQLVETRSADRGLALTENKVDLVVSNFTITEERKKQLAFAGTYLSTKHAPVLSAKSPNIESLVDLADRVIAVVEGTTDHDILNGLGAHCETAPFPTVTECLAALDAGKVDAFWSSTTANVGYINDPRAVRTEGSLKLGGEVWAIGLRQGNEESESFLNSVIADLLGSGELFASLNHWAPKPHI